MRKAIAIGILGLGLVSNRAAAQTAVEQAQILRDFQASVATYAELQTAHPLFPEAVHATTPLPKVFTLPVAMVFRQLIGQAMSGTEQVALTKALPALPTPLEYRLVDHDLIIRDAGTGLVVAVLRDATATVAMTQR